LLATQRKLESRFIQSTTVVVRASPPPGLPKCARSRHCRAPRALEHLCSSTSPHRLQPKASISSIQNRAGCRSASRPQVGLRMSRTCPRSQARFSHTTNRARSPNRDCQKIGLHGDVRLPTISLPVEHTRAADSRHQVPGDVYTGPSGFDGHQGAPLFTITLRMTTIASRCADGRAGRPDSDQSISDREVPEES